MNEAQRQLLLKRLRGIETEVSRTVGVAGQGTRFEREIIVGNILDKQKVIEDRVGGVVVIGTGVRPKEPPERGHVNRDPMYDLELEFSDNGDGFGNPLVNPEPNAEYYVRCRIRQHQADPLLQGFKLQWIKPVGWTWEDGIGQFTVEEATSNPAVITRVATSPATDRGGKFRVVVVARYL